MLRYDARDPEASVPDRRNLPAGCLTLALILLASLAGALVCAA